MGRSPAVIGTSRTSIADSPKGSVKILNAHARIRLKARSALRGTA